MTSIESVHGWPDGEARPMPFGQVLYTHDGTFGGVLNIGQLEIGAWPSVGFALHTLDGPMLVRPVWQLIGAEGLIFPGTSFYHPGDGSVILIGSQGHYLSHTEISGTASSSLVVVVCGSNRPVDQAPAYGRLRSFQVPDPGAGVGSVDLYNGLDGTVGIVHAVTFQMNWGAGTNNNPPAIVYVDAGNNMLTYTELRTTAGAGDFEIISANTSQGGTSGVITNTTLPENAWTVSRTLPAYRLTRQQTARIVLNDPVAGDEFTNIFVLVEEF